MTPQETRGSTDLVQRLRNFCIWNSRHSHYEPVLVCQEAADEIERLRDAKRRALQITDERAKEANDLRAQLSAPADGKQPERETWWLVERWGHSQYVKRGASGTRHDLTDNVWHAERFVSERAACEFIRISESPWAKDLRAIEHMFINKTDVPADGKQAGEAHDAIYLRGWNDGIERAVELLDDKGWRTAAGKISTLLDPDTSPQAAVDQAGQDYFNAIDQSLVVRHLGVAAGNPLEELDAILSWEVSVALDPRVSSAAQALIDSGGAQAAMIEALEKIAYAPPGGVGPTLRESIEIARAALGEKP